ncbi:MAG: hypothetical protein Q7I97_09735 [Thermovirgaceae bacterium]|nr:hypothetical protein [Thermovirgaceae bacterium]
MNTRRGAAVLAFLILATVSPAIAFPPIEVASTLDTAFFLSGRGSSRFPSLGPDGAWVAWYSDAGDLVPDDDNGDIDVFVREISSGMILCVSVTEEGKPAGAGGSISCPRGLSVSAGGEFVAFVSYGEDEMPDVLVYNTRTGTTAAVSVNAEGKAGNGASLSPSISRNGRYVSFMSTASDLVEDDTNGFADIFVRDLETGTLERISLGIDGKEADSHSSSPSISWDGRMVAFTSDASNLVADYHGSGLDVFVFDRATGRTTLASSVSNGGGGNGDSLTLPSSISGDGRSVLFISDATNLVATDTNMSQDLFVRDLASHATLRVSMGDGMTESSHGAISGALDFDGRTVVFSSDSDHLVRGDTNFGADIFLRDLFTRRVELVSRASDGSQVFAESADPSLSGNGDIILFSARPFDLLTGKGKDVWEIFVHDRTHKKTFWVSAPALRP